MFVKVLVNQYLNNNQNFSFFEIFIAQKSTVPTDIGSIDDTTNADNNTGFFDNLRNKIKRFGVYIRDKFWEIIERIGNKFKQIG